MQQYSELTNYFMNDENLSRKHRDKNGQFFTQFSQVMKCIELLKDFNFSFNNSRILEPSCGTGQFVDKLLEECFESQIVSIEKDPIIYSKVYKEYERYSSVYFLNMDFLQYNPSDETDKFDLIIGNPPYVEMSDYGKVEYKSVLKKGRYNIYGYFIEHSLKMLNDKGIICFILPTSLLSAPSFQKLRVEIKKICNILQIFSLDNFSSDVSQGVNIYIFQKVDKKDLNNDYTINHGNVIFTTEQKPETKKYELLGKYAKITTGSIVWNQVKDYLFVGKENVDRSLLNKQNDENKLLKLIYSTDIGNIADAETFVVTGKSEVKLPAIFITRGKNPRHELVEKSIDGLIGENHVNIIHAPIDTLHKIDNYLSSEQCKKYIKDNSGTLNFSKTQLTNLPLFESFDKQNIVFEE